MYNFELTDDNTRAGIQYCVQIKKPGTGSHAEANKPSQQESTTISKINFNVVPSPS
jgi:hypothetical protein